LDKPAAQKAFALRLAQARADKKERGGADEELAAEAKDLVARVAAATANPKVWSFGGDAATICYCPYAVGAYAEGAFGRKIPYAVLRPLARPDFPLP
jgi:hypothetical protein